MLRIERDNEKVVIKFETDLPFDCEGTQTTTVNLTFSCHRPYEAALLERYLRSRLFDAMKEARKEAYAQGWHDAKAKTKKREYFGGNL